VKISGISTVQRPTPRMGKSRSMICSSLSRAADRFVGTVPARAWRDVLDGAHLRPRKAGAAQARGVPGEHLGRVGERPLPKSATKRARMVRAARPLSCWCAMARVNAS
jgi:hypothetical protein